MRALILSKALVVSAYRRKLVEMARQGVEVVAVVPPEWREGGGVQGLEPLEDTEYRLIISTIRLNGHFHLHFYPSLPGILSDVRPDIVHVDEEPYNLATFLAVRAAVRRDMPSVFFSWQNIRRAYPPPFAWSERWVYRNVAGALAGSAEVMGVLRGKGYAGPLFDVPQFGVDPDVFSPSEREDRPFTVGFPNRLVPGKAPLVALRAFARLPRDAQLMILGDGPLRRDVDDEVCRRTLAARVSVRPRVHSRDVPDFLRSTDVIVLPSLTTSRWKEQFGRILIEAMSCGIPVVASDSGEIPNVVGDAGIIVPESDEDALFEALEMLYWDAELRRTLARRGRERVLARYTQGRIAEATVNAYKNVLAG